MRKALVSLVMFFGSVLSALASENSGWAPSITFRSVVANKYIANGSGFTVYDKPVIQTSAHVSFKNGFYEDLWNSAPFKGYDQNDGTEQDFNIGWTGAINKASDMTLDLGAAYLDEPKLAAFGAQDVVYSYAKLSKKMVDWTFCGGYENYTVMPGSSYPGESLFSIGVSRTEPIFNDGTSVNISLTLVDDTGTFGVNHGIFFRGGIEFDWKLTEHLGMILPQVNFCIPVTILDSPFGSVIFGGFSYQI